MPLVGLDACKRTFRVKRALYKRGVGDLRDVMRKRSKCIKKSRGQVRKLEEKVKELGGTLSEDVSDYSSVLCGTSSDSESDTESDKNEVAQKKSEDKPSPKKIVAAETNKTDAAPHSEVDPRLADTQHFQVHGLSQASCDEALDNVETDLQHILEQQDDCAGVRQETTEHARCEYSLSELSQNAAAL